MVVIRRAIGEDASFLGEMLAVAVDWEHAAPRRSPAQLMRQPDLAHYVAGWPHEGDVGFVAETGAPVGAAWWRFFPGDDPGYGFVDSSTPEVSVGVVAQARGYGLGTGLLGALMDEAQRRALPALSLSVDPNNDAARLYQRLGFEVVGGVGGSLTMVVTFGA